MKHIDQETYKVGKENRIGRKTNKHQIIISISLRKDSYHINRLQHKEYGKTKKWNTYSISRDGGIFEHYNPEYYSNYMGRKDVDKKSISIVLENMGSLIKYDDNHYINWLNEICPIESVVNKSFLGLHYWEAIPNEQFYSVIWLCNHLCNQFNIPKKVIDFHHYNKNIHNFNGIVLESNYVDNTSKVNPLFDLNFFNEKLQLID